MTAGEGEVGDKGVENVYLVDLAAAQRAVRPVVEGFGAAYVYVGSDGGRLFFLTSLDRTERQGDRRWIRCGRT